MNDAGSFMIAHAYIGNGSDHLKTGSVHMLLGLSFPQYLQLFEVEIHVLSRLALKVH